jgi:hypothetical protein
MPDQILYVSQGKLFLYNGNQSWHIESRFGNEIRQRALDVEKRREWKTQGFGARFMGLSTPERDPTGIVTRISGISRGCHPGELLYTLWTPEIAGVFSLRAEATEEQRLFHSADVRPEQLDAHPERHRIACVLAQPGSGTGNIAVMKDDCSDLVEVTQGDCLDGAPHWVPGAAEEIVFHSAGVGRDAAGRFAAYGPYSIQRLNLQTGQVQCLAEDAHHDLLAPQVDEAGNLYFIRRPHAAPGRLHFWRTLLDLLLLPYNLLRAVFDYLNFFSARYSGKTLLSSAGARARLADPNAMVIYGNLVAADKAAKAKAGEAPALVPRDWQLVRRSPQGAEHVLARSVVAFDLAAAGAVFYSSGRAVFRLDSEGRSERVLEDACIERIISM